jgi:uncharacterized protein (TIGR03032 family)
MSHDTLPKVQLVAQLPDDTPWLEVLGSRHFAEWLAAQNSGLAFTTYEAGKVFLLGVGPDGRLSAFERTFARCLGLCAAGDSLWLAGHYQLWRFDNLLRPGHTHQGYDRLYVPQAAFTTGDLDTHDVAVEAGGRVVFAATRFSCLATPREGVSFVPLWKPPFVSRLAPEDRCHLNGLAIRDGRAAYVTAVSASDVADGWRDRRREGGLVLDVRSNETIVAGLSMPHSPRWYRDRLWLLDSGTGRFGWVDPAAGRFEPVAFCPGYARGLAFIGDYAVIGLSRPRHDRTFQGLQLDEELRSRGAEPRCGLHVVDLRTGDAPHWLRLEGAAGELYDVAALPGAARPMVLGFKTDEIQQIIAVGESGTL